MKTTATHPVHFFSGFAMRVLVTFTLVIAVCLLLYAATSGPSSGSTFSSSAYGDKTWDDKDHVQSSDDDYATCEDLDDGDSSEYLKVTNFGFAIPASSTIEGIEVFIEKRGESSKIKDASVKIIQSGVISGTEQALTTTWGNSDFTDTYGSATDLWGLTWTDADINASNFGVAIAARKSSNGGGEKKARIDHIQITVHYTSSLPISLKSFNAHAVDNKKIKLEWTTASEKNNDYFTIERSENGASFHKISTVKGAGNSSSIINYNAYDDAPVFGNAYYRLKQTDFDGKFTYSNLISVAVSVSASPKKCKFSVRPNPCPGQCSVTVTECDEKNVSLALLDAMGNEVYSKVPVDANGTFSIDATNNLTPGVYIVMGNSPDQSFSQKVIVR